MARLRKLARGKESAQLMEDVVFNANETENHGITLPSPATLADVEAALRKLLKLLGRQD